MVRHTIKILLAIVVYLFSSTNPVLAAEVIASVDRTELVEGETITLVLQTNDPQQNLSSDLAGLRQDFRILDQRSETQMSIENGRQVAVVRLMYTLEPQRAGDLLIPALSLQGSSTKPIHVLVEPAPELAPGEAPPVFIELSLDPDQGPYYVHAQLALTVRIFYQQNLTEAAINPPAPQQASVRLLDEIPFQSTRNGTRYRVLERRYAIFPERSGDLVIPPLSLSGRLIERPADRLWQPSVRGRRVTVASDPVTIDVLPKPASYTADHWLPARRITLSQQISESDGLQVGEPVTRTVILDAVGLEENMIEEPVWPAMENARIYPDQPQGISRDDGQWVLGHKEFRYAVVPEQAGELVLPEVRLEWWDTTVNQLKTAILPEHRIEVSASELLTEIASPNVAGGASVYLPESVMDPSLLSDVKRWRVVAIIFAVLWMITLILLLRGGFRQNTKPESRNKLPSEEADLISDLKKACATNDATLVRNLFGKWLRRHGPEQVRGSMMDFAKEIDDQGLREAIQSFDAAGFSRQSGNDFNGGEFWKLFASWQQSLKRPTAGTESDPDLYARA